VIEGYGYKIIFPDGSWYWGTSQYKGLPPEKDGYYGSPKTHKIKWKEPHSKIILRVFYDEDSRLNYEEMCILPDLNNPKCLNEHSRRAFSRAVYEKSRGVPRTPEVRKKISEKHRGRKLSPAHIQKLKDADRPPITPETIAKRVASRSGFKQSEKAKEKIKQGNTGKKRSREVKNRIADSVRGYKWYNDGTQSVQAYAHPGNGWNEGRILDWETSRSTGMKWYHKNGLRRMFREDPGDGWERGNPRPKGKRYYNNGSEHVLAFECPGIGWVLGRLKRK
jgi:hypothetical protein